MLPFVTITLVSAALTAAVPHAHSHFKLHEAAQAFGIEARDDITATTNQLLARGVSPLGHCGGPYQCAPGLCCSKYGYCGKGPRYCDGERNSDGTRTHPKPHGRPHGKPHGKPHHKPPPTYSSPPQPPATSYAPSPSSTSAPSPGGGSSGGFGDVYKMYSGNGSPNEGWPSTSNWMSFDSLWEANMPLLKISCEQFGQDNNSDQENNDLKAAIQSSASSSGLDASFILSVIMQESKGCVRVWTTDNGVTNPGLMQSHDGSGSCNSGSQVQNPCPASQIQQMVNDGVNGTPAGDGLKQVMGQCTGTDEAQRYYQAGTIYNSGNLPQNLDDNTATACYASDIANRLTGWTTAATTCNL